ncbi:hypothetical protein LR48_Vigan03g094400 [Vigna angularis]|uniref:Ubiquitin-like protease family profile domain-containing protein n=1 Tax=Phaseolus angularis TaxID=3914 RepID=A0A0L9U4H1_PHAAN|nr:hypothetical protein LR48_Vigan03g094400 [Vigna angularis]
MRKHNYNRLENGGESNREEGGHNDREDGRQSDRQDGGESEREDGRVKMEDRARDKMEGLNARPMASEQANWHLCISMESSSIVKMNRLVGDTHVEHIRMTPFRWCLHIVEPLEVNLKLLKMMVQRLAGHDVSFRVSQELVPFSVLDVFMKIGLDIGGLEIPFDESVVGVVGDMFNPKTTTLKEVMDMFRLVVRDENIEVDVVYDLDSLCLYGWATGVHKHIVQNLNKCMKKIMFGGIACSLSLSGNVAVLQAWAVERLSLHGHYSHRRFPRILRWLPYTATTKEIDNIFKTGDLNLEWYVSKEDCEVAEIRAAFHMDDGGIGEGSMPERSWVQERDDESSDDGTWLAGAEERIRKNNHDIMTLNAKIGVITRELIDIRQTPIFNEESQFGHDEEGVGGAEEAPTSGGDEEDADGDDEQPEAVEPLAIPLLCSYVGDPITTVDVDQLYYAVSVVCEIIGQTLSTTSAHTLAPFQYVDNMNHVISDVRKRPQNQHVYTLHNYQNYMRSDHFGIGDIGTTDYLFLSFVHDNHWWCYSVKLSKLQLFVIDSLGKGVRDRKRIDNFVDFGYVDRHFAAAFENELGSTWSLLDNNGLTHVVTYNMNTLDPKITTGWSSMKNIYHERLNDAHITFQYVRHNNFKIIIYVGPCTDNSRESFINRCTTNPQSSLFAVKLTQSRCQGSHLNLNTNFANEIRNKGLTEVMLLGDKDGIMCKVLIS